MAKSKVLAFINIIGLSLGIACAVLIIFFVKDEITFDKFHSKVDRIYRPWTKAKMRGRESANSATPFNMGELLAENYEEIEKYTVWTVFNETVEKEDQSFVENINIASGFIEFGPYLGSCRFNDCLHNSEPACEVKIALEKGEILDWRYRSYLRLLEQNIQTFM